MDDFDARRASLDLVTAFVSNNRLSADQLPTLLRDVYSAIAGFEAGAAASAERIAAKSADKKAEPAPAPGHDAAETAPHSVEPTAPAKAPKTSKTAKAPATDKPAVPVAESIADPAVIVSLITGEKFKTLKRHLTKHGLTEAEYKARFNLPADYPTVAPAYAEVRRKIASARNASSNKVEPAANAIAPAPAIEEPKAAPRPAQPKSSRPKSSRSKPSKPKAASRPASGAAKAAAGVKPAQRRPAKGPATAPESLEDAGVAPAKAEAVAKAPKKRRMARPLADDATLPTASAAPAPLSAPGAAGGTAASVTEPAVPSAGGAPASGTEVIQAKSTRKERKRLSVKFG